MKRVIATFVLFGVIGIGMCIASIHILIQQKQFIKQAVHASGTVIELVQKKSDDGYTYAPKVIFTTENEEKIIFTSHTSSNPPSFHKEEQVEVLYKKDTPAQAKINAFSTLYMIPLVLGSMGFIFALIGIIPGTLVLRRKKQITYLKQFGMRILSTVTEIEYRKNYKINKKSPYRIWAEGINPKTGTPTSFKSNNIWTDPNPYTKKGDTIEVLVHPQKIKTHYIDTTVLIPHP
jgi:hypothetical protein